MISKCSTFSVTKQYYTLATVAILIPYFFLLLYVENSFQLVIPGIVAFFMVSLGFHTKLLPIFKIRTKPLFVLSSTNIFTIILIILTSELLAARNLPFIGLFYGPYVDHTDYGIPLLHSLFNSLCLYYILTIFTIPRILGNNIAQGGRANSLFLIIFVGLTLQRLPFLFLLITFCLPYLLTTLYTIAFLISQWRLIFNPARITIFLAVLSLLLYFLIGSGALRNDLSSFNFQALGSFSYTTLFSSLNIPSQVAVQYLFTPHLNSYINIHQFNYRDPYLFSTLFPYFAKYTHVFFPDLVNDFFYLPNPVFNARSFQTLLYYLFPLGTFTYLILFYLSGQILSLPYRRLRTIPNSCAITDNLLSFYLFNSSIVTIGMLFSFFIPWWSYPVLAIPVILNFLIGIDL